MMLFVVVGGSFYQHGLVKAALAASFKVLVVDKDPNAYCFNINEVVRLNLSVTDIDGVLSKLENCEVVGAATCQSDIGVKLVGAINERFEINGPYQTQCEIFSSKINFKTFMHELEIGSGQFRLITAKTSTDEIKLETFPLAVKPVDSSGSRGVSCVKRFLDLNDAISLAMSESRSKQVLLEEWYEGLEFGCQVAVNTEGNLSLLYHHDYVFNNIPVGHSLLKKEIPEVRAALEHIVRAARLRNCWMNVDLIETNEKYEFLEIGLRLGATELDRLVTHATNKDPYASIVKSDYSFNVNKTMSPTFGVLFNPFEVPYQLVESDKFSQYLEKNGVNHVLEIQNNTVPPFTDGTKRFGRFETYLDFSRLKNVIQSALVNFGTPLG